MSRLALLCLLLSTLLAAQTLTREQQLSKLRLRESLLQLAERRASLQSHRDELTATKELFDQGFELNMQACVVEGNALHVELIETWEGTTITTVVQTRW